MPKPEVFLGRVTEKVAIVTGAGSQPPDFGTGVAIAYVLAGEGAKVCLVDHDMERAQQTLRLINEIGGTAFIVKADITKSLDCARISKETVARYGRIDILVNNVGISSMKVTLDSVDEEDWDRTMDVNLKGAMLVTKHAIPHMVKQRAGSIVNISSIAALGSLGSMAYAITKGALITFARELATLYGRQGIRANTIAPGHLWTPIGRSWHCDDRTRRLRRDIAPLGIEGDAWDVATAVLFFASDESRFITAQTMAVDGGTSGVMPLYSLRWVADS